MKNLLRLVSFLTLVGVTLCAADAPSAAHDKIVAAVLAADQERLAASIAADPARLDAILSADLHYAHSNGKIDTKASLIDTLVHHRTVYEKFEYQNLQVRPVAPGIALAHGRVLIDLRNGEQKTTVDINFLAVWREEQGQWRFLAWQSCRNNPPTPSLLTPPQAVQK